MFCYLWLCVPISSGTSNLHIDLMGVSFFAQSAFAFVLFLWGITQLSILDIQSRKIKISSLTLGGDQGHHQNELLLSFVMSVKMTNATKNFAGVTHLYSWSFRVWQWIQKYHGYLVARIVNNCCGVRSKPRQGRVKGNQVSHGTLPLPNLLPYT